MVHRSRKSHRKSHRKGSRKHSQRGGNGCSAYPANRAAFSQSGGMAPFAASGNDYLLDAATRVQAEVGPLDRAFGELPSVAQGGGRRLRKSRKHRSRKHRKSHRNQSRRNHRKSQRGGNLYPFSGPSLLLNSGQYATDGTNSQFRTEGSVNALYGEFKGAQA